jgi:hypothetical protein
MTRLVSFLAILAVAAPAPAADVVFNPGRHPMPDASVLLAPDGKTLLSLGSDRCLRLWDVETGKVAAELWLPAAAGIHNGGAYTRCPVWVSPDSKLAAVPFHTREMESKFALIPLTGAGRGTYRVLGGQGWGGVDNAVFSPDGKFIATTAGGQPVTVWEVATGKKVCEMKFDHDMAPRGMFFSPDGKTLTVALPMVNFNGGKHSGISTFDAATGKFLGEVGWKDGMVEPLNTVRRSPDGKTVAVNRLEMVLMAPDGTNARNIRPPDLLAYPDAGAFDSNGRFLVAWWKQGGYTVRDELGGKEVARVKTTGRHPQFSADGSRMLTVDGGDVTLHDLTGRGQTKTIRVAEPAVNALAWAAGPKLGIGVGTPDHRNAGALTAAFDFEKFALADVIVKNDYTRARTEWGGVKLVPEGYSASVTAGGKTVKLDYESEFDWEDVKAATLVGPGHAVLYTGKGTFGYDTKTGKQVATYSGMAGWTLSVSRDGTLFASTHYVDPAIRVYKPLKSDPALMLYVAGNEWVAWTPSGAWTSSPNGAKLAGTMSKEEPGKLRTFAALPKEKNDPDAVKKALK